MKLKTLRLAPFFIAATVIGLMCLLQVLRPDLLEVFEKITYDLRVKAAANHSSDVATNLGFVEISDKSIATIHGGLLGVHYGLYWPRHIYGRLVRELSLQGAQGVAFDILFADLRQDHAVVQLGDGSYVESDEYFSQHIKRAGNVIIAAEEEVVPPMLFTTNAIAIGHIAADKDSDGVLRRAKAFKAYRKWHRAFQQIQEDPDYGVDLKQARIESGQVVLPRSGAEPIKVPLDKDGKFDLADFVGEKIPSGMNRHERPFTEERMWHMGIILAARELKLDLAGAQVDLENGRITLTGTNGLERTIPVDSEGNFYINWRLTANDPHLTRGPIEELLIQHKQRQEGKALEFKRNWGGKLVVVGSSATGNDLTDRGATPLEKDTLLVSEHWNVANSILTGQFVQRASLPFELFLIALAGVTAAFLAWRVPVHIASLLALFIFAGYLALAFIIFVQFHYWLPVVLPMIGGLLTTYGSMLAYLAIFEQVERRRVKAVFNKMVSPDVVNELLKAEKLPTEASRKLTVYFADIRGFTEMTDVNREAAEAFIRDRGLVGEAAEACFERQARETMATVNLYLATIAETVIRHKGTVDKFIGDCVMAFWGAPTPNERHALFCVRAAIDVQRAVYRVNHERELENRRREQENLRLTASGQPPLPMLAVLSVGSGINTGVVTVGIMGWEDRQLNYTVFGRDVNLASRLETVSGRGRIIISEATLAEIIQDDSTLALSCVRLPPVTVKGIRDAVTIYEVPWRTEEHGMPTGNLKPVSAADAAKTPVS